MQPVPRTTYLVVNPFESATSANLAFGVRQDSAVASGIQPTTARAVGAPVEPVPAPAPRAGDLHPATHAAARAALQTQLPPVRSARLLVVNERRRLTGAITLMAAGGAGTLTGLGLAAYAIWNYMNDPEHNGTNALLNQIGTAAIPGVIGGSFLAGGLSLLTVAPAPAEVQAQMQLPVHPGTGRHAPSAPTHVPAELNEIVIDPSDFDGADAGVRATGSKPASPRWDAVAAAAHLPFADDRA